jgi:hypothetical protein
MAWTYSDALTTPKDKVRIRIGDTDSADPVLSDGEITYALELASNDLNQAAIYACEFAVAKYSKQPDTRFGPSSVSGSQRSSQYADLLKQLRRRTVTSGGALPYSGGISKSDKETEEANTDRAKPAFTRAQFAYPGDADGSLSETGNE